MLLDIYGDFALDRSGVFDVTYYVLTSFGIRHTSTYFIVFRTYKNKMYFIFTRLKSQNVHIRSGGDQR